MCEDFAYLGDDVSVDPRGMTEVTPRVYRGGTAPISNASCPSTLQYCKPASPSSQARPYPKLGTESSTMVPGWRHFFQSPPRTRRSSISHPKHDLRRTFCSRNPTTVYMRLFPKPIKPTTRVKYIILLGILLIVVTHLGSSTGQKILAQKAKKCNLYRGTSHDWVGKMASNSSPNLNRPV